MSIKDEIEMSRNEFKPDWASPPGDTIIELLEEKGWTKYNLGISFGIKNNQVNDLLSGDTPISDYMAFLLANILGGTKQFWINREAQYRENLERLGKE